MSEQQLKEFTPEGFEIVYISEYFFNVLEKEMEKISRVLGSPSDYKKMVALRDEPAKVEFRRLEEKQNAGK